MNPDDPFSKVGDIVKYGWAGAQTKRKNMFIELFSLPVNAQ